MFLYSTFFLFIVNLVKVKNKMIYYCPHTIVLVISLQTNATTIVAKIWGIELERNLIRGARAWFPMYYYGPICPFDRLALYDGRWNFTVQYTAIYYF